MVIPKQFISVIDSWDKKIKRRMKDKLTDSIKGNQALFLEGQH